MEREEKYVYVQQYDEQGLEIAEGQASEDGIVIHFEIDDMDERLNSVSLRRKEGQYKLMYATLRDRIIQKVAVPRTLSIRFEKNNRKPLKRNTYPHIGAFEVELVWQKHSIQLFSKLKIQKWPSFDFIVKSIETTIDKQPAPPIDDLAGPDIFMDCPKCNMQDWSHSQQVGDLISVFSEAHPLLGIYSNMAGVSTCQAKDWSSAHQQADLVNVFLQVAAAARSKLTPPFPLPLTS